MPESPNELNSKAIRAHLEKVLASKAFSERSHQAVKFLRFVVEETLAGRKNLKEIAVAIGAFNKPPTFNPQDDPIVRLQAGRVRHKLTEYYFQEGSSDPIRICLRKGSYVPTFSWVSPSNSEDGSGPEDPRVVLYAALADIGLLFQDKRFEETVNAIDTVRKRLDASLLAERDQKLLTSFGALRILSLYALGRFDEVKIEATSWDYTQAVAGTGLVALAVLLVIFEREADVARVADVRARLWSLVVDESEASLEAVEAISTAANDLADVDLHGSAITLLNELIERLRHSATVRARSLYAACYNTKVRFLRLAERYAEALQAYQSMEEELKTESAEQIVNALAWAGIETTRTLRALQRYQEASALAEALQARFDTHQSTEIKTAVAWTRAEMAETFSEGGDFDAAVDHCCRFIREADAAGSNDQDCVAWIHRYKIYCLRKAKRYQEAVDAYDEMMPRFQTSRDPDIQRHVAYASIERIICLKNLKRFAAATTAAKTVASQLANTTNKTLIEERAAAIHQQGDVLICEAKLFRSNGMFEDATLKLQEARQLLIKASAEDPEHKYSYSCRSYAEFLLGETNEAELSFKRALSVRRNTDWLEKDDWADFDLFPIPEDREFLNATRHWREEHLREER